ncbi:MAG: hypothetical protein KC457_13830, partial [Myxococcales bacterium]|nr:hypothetical protein [Myxococcales bacterium]
MRTRTSAAALVAGLTVAFVGGLVGCKQEQSAAGEDEKRSSPLRYQDVPAAGQGDVREVAAASYRRSLQQQLDLLPAERDDYLVIRDLRPLIEQARRIEQILGGPLTRALPALAKLGGGDGQARLQQLQKTRETLALMLAALENSGVILDAGLVIADPGGAPLLLFSAADLQRVETLATLAGDRAGELVAGCGPLADQPGWFACSSAGAEGLAAYRPGMAGSERLAELAVTQIGVDLERVNVALSLGGGQDAGGLGSIDATLRTDPELWELTVPMPMPEGKPLLSTGPAPGLRALVPGTSFAWMRLDPAGFAEGAPGMGALAG